MSGDQVLASTLPSPFETPTLNTAICAPSGADSSLIMTTKRQRTPKVHRYPDEDRWETPTPRTPKTASRGRSQSQQVVDPGDGFKVLPKDLEARLKILKLRLSLLTRRRAALGGRTSSLSTAQPGRTAGGRRSRSTSRRRRSRSRSRSQSRRRTGGRSQWGDRQVEIPQLVVQQTKRGRAVRPPPEVVPLSSIRFPGCFVLLERLEKLPNGLWFAEPVDPERMHCPDYFQVIRRPMDTGTIKRMLATGKYETEEDFANDVRLIWANAMQYNPPGNAVHEAAKQYAQEFERMFAEMQQEIEARKEAEAKREQERKLRAELRKLKGDVSSEEESSSSSSDAAVYEPSAESEMMMERMAQLEEELRTLRKEKRTERSVKRAPKPKAARKRGSSTRAAPKTSRPVARRRKKAPKRSRGRYMENMGSAVGSGGSGGGATATGMTEEEIKKLHNILDGFSYQQKVEAIELAYGMTLAEIERKGEEVTLDLSQHPAENQRKVAEYVQKVLRADADFGVVDIPVPTAGAEASPGVTSVANTAGEVGTSYLPSSSPVTGQYGGLFDAGEAEPFDPLQSVEASYAEAQSDLFGDVGASMAEKTGGGDGGGVGGVSAGNDAIAADDELWGDLGTQHSARQEAAGTALAKAQQAAAGAEKKLGAAAEQAARAQESQAQASAQAARAESDRAAQDAAAQRERERQEREGGMEEEDLLDGMDWMF